MTKFLVKCIVPVFALALILGGVPAYASAECSDSPSVVVLPDCTTISITTCYCEVSSAGEDDLAVTITDLGSSVAAGTLACDGTLCAVNGDLASDVRVDDVQKRNTKNLNATPAKNGKTSTDADCDDCPGTSVGIDVGPSTRKNSHFDLLLETSGDAFICKVGFNSHTLTCD